MKTKQNNPTDDPNPDGMLQLCYAVWTDYHAGRVDYEGIKINDYSKRYGVSQFPKNLIAPLLLKRTQPDSEDASALRSDIAKYHNFRSRPSAEELKEQNDMIRAAISVLKASGYRIMKKTTAYIDV